MYHEHPYDGSNLSRKIKVTFEESGIVERTLSAGISPEGIRLLEQFFRVSQFPNPKEVAVLALSADTTTENLLNWCK